MASLGQRLEQELARRLAMGVVQGFRGKNPGVTPRSGVPPGVLA